MSKSTAALAIDPSFGVTNFARTVARKLLHEDYLAELTHALDVAKIIDQELINSGLLTKSKKKKANEPKSK